MAAAARGAGPRIDVGAPEHTVEGLLAALEFAYAETKGAMKWG